MVCGNKHFHCQIGDFQCLVSTHPDNMAGHPLLRDGLCDREHKTCENNDEGVQAAQLTTGHGPGTVHVQHNTSGSMVTQVAAW